MNELTNHHLLISCHDQPGIVYRVTEFLYQQGANVSLLDQHTTDPQGGEFFMRLEFERPQFKQSMDELSAAFQKTVADEFGMQWFISQSQHAKKMAILVSKHDHALLELLWRWSCGELNMQIPVIISNHPDLAHFAEQFNIPFRHITVDKQNKSKAEDEILSILTEFGGVDGIILARYMQILSEEFVNQYPHKIINIHHSFLPAFVGANPYQQAYDKGVKLIGATAHYVTADLDMGPIITQEVTPVSHRLDAKQLQQLGRHLERLALAKAVDLHLDDRILVHNNKTIVFSEH